MNLKPAPPSAASAPASACSATDQPDGSGVAHTPSTIASGSRLHIFLTGREIARWQGGVFLTCYAAYVAYLILATQQHDALAPVSAVMTSFVVPLTVITLLVVMLRKPAAAP